MKPFIYLRALKHVDYSVFCVADGQKTYWDPQFNRESPFSSGQQVKRSILTFLMEELQETPSPVTFVAKLNKDKQLGEGEPHSACDPMYVDQLLGGWMKAEKKDDSKGKKSSKGKKEGDVDSESEEKGKTQTFKRRSPLSISAMRPLHPLLAGKVMEDKLTFDRSSDPEDCHKVKVRGPNGAFLSEAETAELLRNYGSNPYRHLVPSQKRASGLFVYDVAIDLRTLFCVSTSESDPEVDEKVKDTLREAGWKEGRNVFGACLIAPERRRRQVIPALASALIDWRITSNQARTFSLMETLAVAVSDNANTLASTIRAELIDDGDDLPSKAKPIVQKCVDSVDLFVSLASTGYVLTDSQSADALEAAKKRLTEMMLAFDYENQVLPK